MKELEKKTEVQENELLQQDEHIKHEIVSLLEKISSASDLERIRCFVEYIYVHH